MTTSPIAAYDARVASGTVTADAAQRHAMEQLQALFTSLGGLHTKRAGLLSRMFGHATLPCNGLYIYGSVGRGKSMLMDLFFASVAGLKKRRVHFHAFMLDVHRRMHAFRQAGEMDDLLPRVVTDLADEVQLLCLDEFQVSDVTDAMILARLFTGLFEKGVVVVMTSNRHPRDLYQGGLQRDQFLKFVALVEKRMEMVEIASPTDYRLKQLISMQRTYFTPLGEEADQFLLDSWNTLTDNGRSYRLDIEVQGRKLRVDKHNSGIAWLTFDELCARPLGANDYLSLARICHTLLLQNIPQMNRDMRNEAKRFVTLIDTLYEAKVKLIATAGASPDDLYPKGDGSFEFQRTASRLHEMQSETYLAHAHLA